MTRAALELAERALIAHRPLDNPIGQRIVDEAIAAIRTALAAGEGSGAQGWKLVPIHPTVEMIEAGHSAPDNAYGWGVVKCVVHYRAMLDAAPSPEGQKP